MSAEQIVWDAPAASVSPQKEDITWDKSSVTMSDAPYQRRAYASSEVPAAALKNLPKSAASAVSGVYQAVTSPAETLQTISQAIGGGFYNALPEQAQKFVVNVSENPEGLAKSIDTANAIGGIYKDRYGDWEKIKRTVAEDPVGAISDLSLLFSGGAAAASKVGLAKTAGALTTAASATNPLNVVVKPVEMMAKSKNALLQSQKEANVVRDANVLAAQREGFVVTPGSLTPTGANVINCLLYTSPSPRDGLLSRMPSSA